MFNGDGHGYKALGDPPWQRRANLYQAIFGTHDLWGISNKEASQMCNGRQFLIVGLAGLDMVCDVTDGLLNKSEHCRKDAFVHK